MSDAECHSSILSFSDVLDVMSEGIDQKESAWEYVAVQVVLVLHYFWNLFTCLGSILMKSSKTEYV